jgi:putative signal transducing protein
MFESIRSYDNYVTATIGLHQLQEEGINCYLENENMVTLVPYLSNAIGGIQLMVHKTQLERAREILAKIEES